MINWWFWFMVLWVEIGWSIFLLLLGIRIGERETKYKFGLSTKRREE